MATDEKSTAAPDRRPRCAIRLGGGDDARLGFSRFIDDRRRYDVTEFQEKDDDELNAKVCEGRFEIVVYPDLESLFLAVWKGDADLAAWKKAGVELYLAHSPVEPWRPFVEQMYESLVRWRNGERRRQIIAGTILSAAALAAVATLLWVTS